MPPRQKPQKRRITLPCSPTLKSIHTTLHLLYHRNKNQHGGATWWKWLAMLKRSMGGLVRAVRRWERVREDEEKEEEEEEEEEDSGDGAGALRVKVLERMRYMHVWVVPRCYVAFSTVVADTQFSALGVVLLAALAQASQAVAQAEQYHPLAKRESDTRTGNVLPDIVSTTASTKLNEKVDVDVDVGEVVMRSLYVPSPAADSASASAREKEKVEEAGGQKGDGKEKSRVILDAAEEGRNAGMVGRSKRESSLAQSDEEEEGESARQKRKKLKTKRKKKKGDAIDDIFGGL